MAKRRTVQQVDHDARAVELRRRHLTYRQIAAKLGVSVSSAHDAVQRGLADVIREPAEAVRDMELQRLDELARAARKVLNADHYAVGASGKVALDPVTGLPLLDHGPTLAAIRELRAIGESRRKFLGLDAPAKVQQEVTHVDSYAVELAQLVAELAAGGQGPAAGHPEVLPVAPESTP